MPARRNSGAKVIPINVKKAQGTYRKDRDITLDKPPVNPDIAVAPSWLNKRAREIFTDLVINTLHPLNLASKTYEQSIADLASAIEKVERYTKLLDGKGETYDSIGSTGQKVIKDRPEVLKLKDANSRKLILCTEFGLTPSSFAKAGGVNKPKTAANPFEGF